MAKASAQAPIENRLRLATAGWRPTLRRYSGHGPRLGAWRWWAWAERLVVGRGPAGSPWYRLAAILHGVAPAPARPALRLVVQRETLTPIVRPTSLALYVALPLARYAVSWVQAPASPGMAPAMQMRQAPLLAAPSARATEAIVTRLRQRQQWITRHESRLVERILVRQESSQAIAQDSPSITRAAPVLQIVKQPSTTTAAAAAVSPAVVAAAVQAIGSSEVVRPGAAATAPHSAPRYWDDTQPPAPQAAFDVERLTDQVIRSIDQRVIAARERLGKG
jgi:hypothetical protein